MTSLPERPRRLRTTPALRDLVAETHLRPEHLILPVFVMPGHGKEEPIASLPGVARYSVDRLVPIVERAMTRGLRSVMLFGVVPNDGKDAEGTHARSEDGPVPQALRTLRERFGRDLVLMTDVCLCGYTDHGHCGLLEPPRPGQVEARIANDATLPHLAAMATLHAAAGADVVAPSDMMDGRVAALRRGLDAAGFHDVSILAYAVKYASAFYGPFRDAAGSAPNGGALDHPVPHDRATYQMDYRNAREAGREVRLDLHEGADLVMVKPALAYLDVIQRVRDVSDRPVVAYQVSGEHAMLHAAAAAGVVAYRDAVIETLTAMRRAGADLILSYATLDVLDGGWAS